MRFAHIEMTDKEAERQGLVVMKSRGIQDTLRKIHKVKMLMYHHSYCPDAMWRLMQERCIVMTEEGKVLVLQPVLQRMLEIYMRRNSDYMSFYKIKEFDPIIAMFVRGQVSEC